MSSLTMPSILFSARSWAAIRKFMEFKPRPSSGIVAAGMVAILGGTVAGFSIFASLLVFSRVRLPASSALPANLRPLLYLTWFFVFLCAVFVVIAGVQAIRLRNWARISLLV